MENPPGTCDNCAGGTEKAGLAPVRRRYPVPTPVTVAEIEWWCSSCRSQYSHAEAGAARGEDIPRI